MTIKLTYEQVEEYHKRLSNNLSHVLSQLEDTLISSRDDLALKIPVYLTKWRIKSVPSIYLKTKRKGCGLDQITDYGGLRVLCLFEQDVFTVNSYLIDILLRDVEGFHEIKLFNWGKGDLKERLVFTIKEKLKSKYNDSIIYDIDTTKQERGYRSIHYVVYCRHNNLRIPVEIQVRTLLQDVWGELEHALVYKRGNIHPHIQKSFYLLSRDLETADKLMSHLRDIRDKEKRIEHYAKRHTGPYKILGYEDHLIPDTFKQGGRLHAEFSVFDQHLRSSRAELAEWIGEFDKLYQIIVDSITPAEYKTNKIKYWVAAEEAFLDFMKGELDDAIIKYEELIKTIKVWRLKYYVPYFRLGEIRFIHGDIERALVLFDRSEDILSTGGEFDPVNAYRIKVKLANTYWQLGKEYFSLALDKIREAEDIMMNEANSQKFDEQDYRLLINNLCWYYLENYIAVTAASESSSSETEREKLDKTAQEYYEESLKYFNKIEEIFSISDSHNALDTLMWFCYQSFLKTGDKNFLEKARSHCYGGPDGKRYKIYATNKIISEKIFHEHVQEIMSVE